MERYVYLNNKFFDRVCNTAEEMARSLKAEIVSVKPYNCPMCGQSEIVHLRKV